MINPEFSTHQKDRQEFIFSKIKEDAVEAVALERKLSDGQIERTWHPDHFADEVIRLTVIECNRIYRTWTNEVPCSEGYDVSAIEKVKEHFGCGYGEEPTGETFKELMDEPND